MGNRYNHRRNPKVNRVGRAIWGTVAALNVVIAVVFIQLWFGGDSVLVWFLYTKYSVWLLLMVSAIVGISFAYSTRNANQLKIKLPQRVMLGARTHLKSISLHRPLSRVERVNNGKLSV